MKSKIGVDRARGKTEQKMTLEGSIKFHNLESNRMGKVVEIKIYLSMIKEIYEFL